MHPKMMTGTIGIASSSFSSSSQSWLEINLGFVPEVLYLFNRKAIASSGVGGAMYNFNDESSSVVKAFWKLAEHTSKVGYAWIYTSSSASYAVKIMSQGSFSASSSSSVSALTVDAKRGFKLYKTAAAAWKNADVQYMAFPKLGARVKDFSSLSASSYAAGS